MNIKGDNEITIWDQIVSQQDKITRIVSDIITPGILDTLVEEIGGVLVTIKSYDFDGGQEYEHLDSTRRRIP